MPCMGLCSRFHWFCAFSDGGGSIGNDLSLREEQVERPDRDRNAFGILQMG